MLELATVRYFNSSGIYGTNAYENGVYIGVSRFNHSCRSNAELSWNCKTKQGRVYINVFWVVEFRTCGYKVSFILRKKNGLQGNCCILWIDLTPGNIVVMSPSQAGSSHASAEGFSAWLRLGSWPLPLSSKIKNWQKQRIILILIWFSFFWQIISCR